MCFLLYLGVRCVGGGGGGGSPKGMVHIVLMQSFTLGSSNIEVSDNVLLCCDHL